MRNKKNIIEEIKRIIPVPEDNAFYNLTLFQKFIVFLVFVFFIFLVYHHLKNESFYIFYVISSIYLIICIHKFSLIFAGIFKDSEMKISEYEILSNHSWPFYTILLPVYKEKEIFPQLFNAIERIDYPRNRLEVLLLVEEDDEQMHKLLEEEKLPPWWKVVVVPDFPPKTKGKALNYGLLRAKGEFLVIYDAEDIPEPDQLKKAAIGFKKADSNVICLQAKLNYYNPYQNILTEWFTAEYTSWFDLYLPGIDSIKAPIPLGGTSNHFKTEILRKLNGWDPFNVTEDCDLGIRIFKSGYRTKTLDTTTWEEANSKLGNWIKQRSRWVKGYIQTYFVNMRKPFELIKKMGILNFLHFNIIVGGNFFTLCFNPVAWFLLILWLFSPGKMFFPNKFFLIVTPVLLIGNIIFVLINVIAVFRRKWYRLIIPSLFSPVYWLLMSAGAWKGLFQYFRKPHFWEKTTHALFFTEVRPPQN